MEIYNGYEYNEFGVCLNPDIPYKFGEWKEAYFEIKVSETPKGWVYGYYYSYELTGGASGCNLDSSKVFVSRSKAIIGSAEVIREILSFAKKSSKAIAELDRIIEAESTPKPKVKQYTIFDYL